MTSHWHPAARFRVCQERRFGTMSGNRAYLKRHSIWAGSLHDLKPRAISVLARGVLKRSFRRRIYRRYRNSGPTPLPGPPCRYNTSPRQASGTPRRNPKTRPPATPPMNASPIHTIGAPTNWATTPAGRVRFQFFIGARRAPDPTATGGTAGNPPTTRCPCRSLYPAQPAQSNAPGPCRKPPGQEKEPPPARQHRRRLGA